jgi:DNA adenine methylase
MARNIKTKPLSEQGCLFKSYTTKSPLQYPGGKSRAVKYLLPLFPKNLKEVISPFLGGGSLELMLAAQGISIKGFDIFEPLVEFWQCLLTQPFLLANEVEKYFPLSKEKFYEIQSQHAILTDKLSRAAVFFVLNRCSFSGLTFSGGMSPGHPYFTKTIIDRVRYFYNPLLEVEIADFETSLNRFPDAFAYLDPPYLTKNYLYGARGNMHKNFDHHRLAFTIKERPSWILSYNNCTEIRKIYKNHFILTPKWTYTMSSNKNSNELVIFSRNYNPEKCIFE